jgi:hypothetical protein
MTIVPSIGTVSITRRIASTATWSDLWRRPAHRVGARDGGLFDDAEEIEGEVGSMAIGSTAGKLAAGRTVGAIAEQVVGLHQLVNFARAFVDDRALAVA